jgi:MFS family permease
VRDMTSRGVFFGWYVALAFSVMAFVSTGIRFAIGPFLKPMVADLGLDRGSFSLVIAVGLLVYGVFQPFVGTLIDRLGSRTLVVAGAVLMGASLVATGYVTKLWHLYLWFGIVSSVGLAATGPVVGSAVLSAWFARRRTTALSLLGSASMAGMTLLVPATMWCVLTFGWRTTYVLFGVASVLLFVPLGLFFVRDTPEVLGLTPDGEPLAPASKGAAAVERTDLADASRTLPFWQLSLGLFTCGFSMSLLSAHGVPMLTDHGYHPMVASWTLGVLGGSSALFGIVLGALSDRFGRRPMLAWLYASRALIFLGLFLVRDQSVVIMVIAVLGGASMAGTVAMSSALTAEIYGRLSVGSVFGTMFLVHQVGGGIGSWLSGALYEMTGGYGAAFVVDSALLLVAALLSITINERSRVTPQLVPVAGGR